MRPRTRGHYRGDLGDYRERDRIRTVAADVDSDRREDSLVPFGIDATLGEISEHLLGPRARTEHSDVGAIAGEERLKIIAIALEVMRDDNRGRSRRDSCVARDIRRILTIEESRFGKARCVLRSMRTVIDYDDVPSQISAEIRDGQR